MMGKIDERDWLDKIDRIDKMVNIDKVDQEGHTCINGARVR